MMQSIMNNEEEIEIKKKEIENYERIMKTYRGRWYDYGKRSLEKLKEELEELIKKEP